MLPHASVSLLLLAISIVTLPSSLDALHMTVDHSGFSGPHTGEGDKVDTLTSLGGKSLHVSWDEGGGVAGMAVRPWEQTKGAALYGTTAKIKDQKSFVEFAKSVNWTSAKSAISQQLLPYLEQEHPVPLHSCSPVEPEVSCTDSKANGLFKGPRPSKAYMVDSSIFGFDLDQFEVKLHELNGVVDLFCVIEMPVTHKGESKPLLWARNMDSSRFARFKHKILHIVVDDSHVLDKLRSDASGDPSKVNWEFENTQEAEGARRVREMVTKLLKPHASSRQVVIAFGDADEIAMPRTIAMIKHCEPKEMPIDVGSWMPNERLDYAFRTDWPVSSEFPYTFGNPSFHDLNGSPTRTYGRTGRFLLGGWHLTNYAYLPFALLKETASTSYQGVAKENADLLASGMNGVNTLFHQIQQQWEDRLTPVADLSTDEPYKSDPELLKPPRIIQCNRERYEAWWGIPDRRVTMKASPAPIAG